VIVTILPLPVWPLLLQVLVAGGVPSLDVSTSCRRAAEAGSPKDKAGDLMKSCIRSEQQTRSELQKNWPTFPNSDRVWCKSAVQGFAPTYTELAACLDMKKALADAKRVNPQSVPKTTGTAPTTLR
jgi:hypothetical protein